MTPRERTFQQAVANMYERAAKGHEEYVWRQQRYERLKAEGWWTEAAFKQAQYEAQVRFHSQETVPCPDCGEALEIPEGADRVSCEGPDGCSTSWKVRFDGGGVRLVDPFRPEDLTDDDRRDAAAGR